jgi:hypothetical protein
MAAETIRCSVKATTVICLLELLGDVLLRHLQAVTSRLLKGALLLVINLLNCCHAFGDGICLSS